MESAFESRVNKKAGTVFSSNAKADTLNKNRSNWKEKSESGEETEALTRLEIELEELLQSHLEVQIQQRAQQQQEHDQQQQQQEHDQQQHKKQQHGIRLRRSEAASQTVYQYQKKPRKCANLRSQGIANGSNALSYMSFVAAIITLVLNINNNINANNNNNNQVNLNFGNNNNLVTNLNQNVGNNFNLMFPPGRKRRRRRAPQRKSRKTYRARRDEREMRNAWSKVGRESVCEIVELGTTWNLLKTSMQMEQAS